MPQPNDQSRSLVALDQNSTIIAVVELSQSSWLVAGMLPGIERQPRKKLEPNPERLLGLLHRWRDEAVRAGRTITRIALAFEAGRDGFWLARWLAVRGIEAHVIHASSLAVSREHRRGVASHTQLLQEIARTQSARFEVMASDGVRTAAALCRSFCEISHRQRAPLHRVDALFQAV
jgi:hypothetical protein